MNLKNLFNSSTDLPQEKRQRILGIVLLLIILSIFVTVYFGFWHDSSGGTSDKNMQATAKKAEKKIIMEKLELDTSFLKSSLFKNLRMYGEWPLEVKEKGRINPFLPY